MRSPNFPHLNRYLNGVHRRLMLLRIIERIGVGITFACALALPLMAMLAWRGASATMPVLLCIALGAIGGAAWGLSQMPTLLQAAIEADRQLQWADLLGTALAADFSSDDPWQRAVLINADRRCSAVSPSSLLLRRLGPRAWGGIVLLITLVTTLCAWIGSPTQSLASDTTISSLNPSVAAKDSDNRPLLTPIAIDAIRPSAAPPEGEDAAPANQASAKPDETSGATTSSPRGDTADKQNTSSDGQGGTLGRSSSTAAPANTRPDTMAQGRAPVANGKTAGGSAAASDESIAGLGTSSGRVGHGTINHPSMVPWTTSDWQAEMRAAGQAVTSGDVPPTDRDLVRDYFQRD